MANIFSDVLTLKNQQAVVDAGVGLGINKISTGIVNLTVNPTNLDVLMFMDLPSDAKISSITQYNDSLGTGSQHDIGIFAAVDFKGPTGLLFKENSVISNAVFDGNSTTLGQINSTVPVDVRYTAGFSPLSDASKELWELAGLLEDPTVPLRLGYIIETNWTTFTPGSIVVIVSHLGK